jgi:hypothetical protein
LIAHYAYKFFNGFRFRTHWSITPLFAYGSNQQRFSDKSTTQQYKSTMAGITVAAITSKSKSVALVCGVAVAATAYLLLSRKNNRKGEKDIPKSGAKDGTGAETEVTPSTSAPTKEEDAAAEVCQKEEIEKVEAIDKIVETAVAVLQKVDSVPFDEAPKKNQRRRNKKKKGTTHPTGCFGDSSNSSITTAITTSTSTFDAPEFADENEQNIANTIHTTVTEAAMTAKLSADEALASAALIAAKKAAKNSRKNNNRRKSKAKGTAQKAAVRELQDFQNKQGIKK